MSDVDPLQGSPEYLEQDAGAPLAAPAAPRRSRKKPLLIGGGAILALGAAGGAWALTSFFSQGPQPAVALPSETVAYVSIDLDPSGGQKIEALRTLNKFPSFKDKIGLSTSDDIRRRLIEEYNKDSTCKVDYGSDVEPWLGDRAAVAAVDVGEKWPTAVEVVQVKDDAKAEAGIKKLIACAGASNEEVGYSVNDGWAVLGAKQDQVDKVVTLTKGGSLADDATYQKWISTVGDPGIVNLYVAPSAGGYLAKGLDQLGNAFAPLGESGGTFTATATATAAPASYHAKPVADCSGSNADPLGPAADVLHSFNGMALTVRFHGGALEVETALDSGQPVIASDQADAVIGTLPSDTPAALGLSLDPEWLTHVADQVAAASGCSSSDELLKEWSAASGLDLPADFKTLVGSSLSVSLGKDFDPKFADQSGDGVGVPAAVKIKGDPAAIRKVLDKLVATAGSPHDAAAAGSDEQGDVIVVGPTPAYRQELLGNGGLGQSSAYRDVIAHSTGNSAVLYLDLDSVRAWAGDETDDPELKANLEPLAALGASAWMDGKVSHSILRITTH